MAETAAVWAKTVAGNKKRRSHPSDGRFSVTSRLNPPMEVTNVGKRTIDCEAFGFLSLIPSPVPAIISAIVYAGDAVKE